MFRYLLQLRDDGISVPNYAIASTVLQSAEHKLLKNIKIPIFTKKKLFYSTMESVDELCPEVKEDDDDQFFDDGTQKVNQNLDIDFD